MSAQGTAQAQSRLPRILGSRVESFRSFNFRALFRQRLSVRETGDTQAGALGTLWHVRRSGACCSVPIIFTTAGGTVADFEMGIRPWASDPSLGLGEL